MMHALIAPNLGHPIVHHFGNRASVWGRTITPTISHVVQSQGTVNLECTRIRPGIVFDAIELSVKDMHVINLNTIRFQIEAAALRRAGLSSRTVSNALIAIRTENDCLLKLWGMMSSDQTAAVGATSVMADRFGYESLLLKISFWEISGISKDETVEQLRAELCEKDRRIRELELKIALSMAAQ